MLLLPLALLLACSLLVLLLASRVVSAAMADLPVLAEEQSVSEPQTTQVFAADGSTLAYLYGTENRTVVKSQDISTFLKHGIVAIEDRRFYEHHGVDYTGLARALVTNVESKSVSQGASTITEQLVDALYLNREVSVTRKVEEAALAIQYEKKYNKDEILTQYLNTVYFGSNAYGVEAAAETYFDKEPKDLTLPEAALLAGLPQAPSGYDPRLNPRAAETRRNEVLLAMWQQGYISKKDYDDATATPIRLAPYSPYAQVREPYVVDYVKQQLISMFGAKEVFQGGLRVQTTIDPKLQDMAEKAIKGILNRSSDPAAALVSVDPKTGYIRAMVDSTAYSKSQFNLATQAYRQPGSAFKPFCLIAAIEDGMDPATTYFTSEPLVLHIPGNPIPWSVHTFGNKYAGTINLVEATLLSDNSVYAQLALQVGAGHISDVAHRMGITTPINNSPVIVLGGLTHGVSSLEMASAYATLADQGTHVQPSIIAKVTDATGKVL